MSNVTSECIQKWIKSKYDSKYHVLAEAVEHKRNYILYNDKRLYYPDVLLKDCNGNIIYIIEVEVGSKTTTIRKSVVGATILADYCIGILNIKKRVDIAKSYCSNLNQVKVYLWDNFQQLTL